MKWRPMVISLAITIPLVAMFLRGMRVDPRYVPPAIPGQPAPDFALERMPMADDPSAAAREPIRLSDFRGKIVVLNFWATWCAPCRAEHPELVAAARAYQGRGVVFLGILYNDSPAAARAWLEEMGGEVYPTLLDPGARTAIDYGLTGVPETVIVDRNGVVAFKRIGMMDREAFARELEPLLADGAGEGSRAATSAAAAAGEATS
ncbi:MAG TPA: TlpA disulfide reductase family protein [Longimicrobiales bacterium]